MKINRWSNYRKANDKFPKVRKNELNLILKKICPTGREVILECGTGNGYLTFPMASRVKNKGKVITYDTTKENLEAVNKANLDLSSPIIIREQKTSYDFDEEDSSIDKVVSLASFHHYDNLSEKTGFSGRLKALKEFNRVLKKGGKLIIGDVGKDTGTAKYFAAINIPKYCYPNGHPHDFLSQEDIKQLCKKSGFVIQTYEVKHVPWTFDSEEQAEEFLHTIHNAKCSLKDSLKHAKKFLRFWEKDGKYYLDWELFYLVAAKK